MKPGKWNKLAKAENGKVYFAMLSYLPVKSYLAIPLVLKNASRIDRQLRETKGLIGFAFQPELFKKQFWTLSVWEGQEFLNAFVSAFPHNEVMKILTPHMKQTKFTDWKIKGIDLPPDWNDAKNRSQNYKNNF